MVGLFTLVTGIAGPSGFGSASTAEQVTEGIDASNITAIVTGGASGIGLETARVLSLRKAHVIIAARNMEAAKEAKQLILNENESARVDMLQLDLCSVTSVRAFVDNFIALDLPLNILINNAGVMFCPFQLSADGIETQFATNHLGISSYLAYYYGAQSIHSTLFTTHDTIPVKLYRSGFKELGSVKVIIPCGHHKSSCERWQGHFLLTNLLLDKMKQTAKTSGIEGRIVNLSSIAHTYTYEEGIRFDKINDPVGYSDKKAYGQSKLANILHANELSRRLKEEGVNITVNSVHPGIIMTPLMRHSSLLMHFLKMFTFYMWKNIPQGAATTCYVALHPSLKSVSGKYFLDCNEFEPSALATNEALGRKLWDSSNKLINSVSKA